MQAVSRKVEGIEPRNCRREGRRFRAWRKSIRKGQTGAMSAPRAVRSSFPGVLDNGMYDMETVRQPGRPYVLFQGRERVPTTERRQAELADMGSRITS